MASRLVPASYRSDSWFVDETTGVRCHIFRWDTKCCSDGPTGSDCSQTRQQETLGADTSRKRSTSKANSRESHGFLERMDEMPLDIVYEFCSVKNVKTIYWGCRVRCCSRCIKQQFVTLDELVPWIPEEIHIKKPASIFPYTVLTDYNVCQPSKRALYFAPKAKQYLAELSQLIASSSDKKAVDTWLQNKRQLQLERIKHASLCEHWYEHWVERPPPGFLAQIPLFDLCVTLVLSVVLVYLWKDALLG
ncbi:hypothetical protein FA15DRAFT_593864 [Coprinopsis marcescibilis]|uniref:Uncharacterized protein n=1 Tax=Coprinopsis marcescibilis TaxID=230819 RepID=A0A5C3KTL4_COPMA|nr:hypothetical protein FA15DRAFT_593864 [Coprinopsis marcescibilis]